MHPPPSAASPWWDPSRHMASWRKGTEAWIKIAGLYPTFSPTSSFSRTNSGKMSAIRNAWCSGPGGGSQTGTALNIRSRNYPVTSYLLLCCRWVDRMYEDTLAILDIPVKYVQPLVGDWGKSLSPTPSFKQPGAGMGPGAWRGPCPAFRS